MMNMVQRRKELGLSQSALARAAEMHAATVSSIESGRLIPWPGQAKKIAAALDWPEARVSELFEDEDLCELRDDTVDEWLAGLGRNIRAGFVEKMHIELVYRKANGGRPSSMTVSVAHAPITSRRARR